MPLKAFHAFVEGEVQGVGFRYAALREALVLGLSGWVRNAEDGRVEVWAEGGAAELESFAAWLRQGPQWASVEGLRLTWEKPRGLDSTFTIKF